MISKDKGTFFRVLDDSEKIITYFRRLKKNYSVIEFIHETVKNNINFSISINTVNLSWSSVKHENVFLRISNIQKAMLQFKKTD